MPRGRPRKTIPSPPEAPVARQQMHSAQPDLTKDWTGFDYYNVPHWVVLAAKVGASSNRKIIGKVMCIQCKRDTWQTDPREDMCQECEYLMRRDNWDMRIERDKRNARQSNNFVNPFSENESGGVLIPWPKDE